MPEQKFHFKDMVLKTVSMIPWGRVMSYGQVALFVGIPRAARQVGWILNRSHEPGIPWWRVVNNEGRVSIKGSEHSAEEQKNLLIAEGVDVNDNLTFEIEDYRYFPDPDLLKGLGLEGDYLTGISQKIPGKSDFR